MRHPRKLGVLVFTVGVVLAYYSLIDPIVEARHGVQMVSLSVKGGFVGLLAVFIGLPYVILGVRAARWIAPTTGESKRPLYALCSIIFAGAMLATWAVVSYLNGMGYH
jgi:hypothetical protein